MANAVYQLSYANEPLPVYHGVGGNFSMESTLGQRTAVEDFSSKVVLISFGYTNCSDVCPVTLSFLNNVVSELDEQGKNTQVLFVSVDPEYDTIEHLRKYLSYFNKDFVGLTGTQAEIKQAVDLYNIRYSKTSEIQVSTKYRKKQILKDKDEHAQHHGKGHGNGHGSHEDKSHQHHDTSSLYSHSTYIYLLDTNGRVRGVFDTTTAVSKLSRSILNLLSE
jgi:protein SCO1/2